MSRRIRALAAQLTASSALPCHPILIDGGSSGVPGTSIFSGALGDFSDSFGITFDPSGSARPFLTGETNDFYNYAPVNYIQLPQTRFQANAMGHFEITENIEVYGRMMFTQSKVPQQLAPTPIFQPGSQLLLLPPCVRSKRSTLKYSWNAVAPDGLLV